MLTVRPIRIKRLAARDNLNTVLYNPVESPVLEFWADFGFSAYSAPPMIEGQEVHLSGMPAISIPRPPSSSLLVVIASLTYLGHGLEDNDFQLFSSATNFGAGTQTLVINKIYSKPGQGGAKPTWFPAPGYEITFEIETQDIAAPTAGVVQQPGTGTIRTPGTVSPVGGVLQQPGTGTSPTVGIFTPVTGGLSR